MIASPRPMIMCTETMAGSATLKGTVPETASSSDAAADARTTDTQEATANEIK